MSATSPLPRLHTYGDLRQWSDDIRWEIIDGQALAMTAPSWQHQSVSTNLILQLGPHFRPKGCRVFAAPFDVRLPEGIQHDDAIPTVVQPDISVVCDARKLDSRGCRGAPDLVVEIISPSTAARAGEAGFRAAELLAAAGTLPSPGFPGLEIDWDEVFADVSAEP